MVLLLKRSGNISAKSDHGLFAQQAAEWISATPLVLCVPTIARLAMRTRRAVPSSIRLMLRTTRLIAGILCTDVVEEAAD